MTVIVITGANKGLGQETARQLIALGHTVYAGARDPERGQLAADRIGARFLRIDVRDDASVAAAVDRVRDEIGHLDVLINNAGISGGLTPPAETTAEDLAAVYATNVFGVVRVTHAFLPLLAASETPVIVNVSSGMGSISVTNDPARMESKLVGLAYPSSKTALNMITTMYAKGLPHMRVNAVDPGYTATDLNGHRGTQTIPEGVVPIVRMATIGSDGPTGTFTDANGVVAW